MPSRCVNQTSWHQVEIKDSSADHQRTLIWGEYQSGNSLKIAQKLDSQSSAWVTVYSSKLSFLFLAPSIFILLQGQLLNLADEPGGYSPLIEISLIRLKMSLFYRVVERTMMGQIIKHHNT